MSPRIIAFAAAIPFALTGCGQMQTFDSTAAVGCTPSTSNCRIAVTVTGNCSDPAQITVLPERLPVPRGNHNMKIAWDIQNSGFKWVAAPNGITSLPPGEFSNPHDNTDKYDITDLNSATAPTPFKYEIHLQRSDGSLCAVKDPFIVNGS